MLFDWYHPYTSFTNAKKRFLKSDKSLAHERTKGALMSDDEQDLWDLGKTAFDALPKFNSISEFDAAYASHVENIEGLANSLADPSLPITFVDENGENCLPNFFAIKRSSQILDVYWQLLRKMDGPIDLLKVNYLFACLEEIDAALVSVWFDGGGVHAIIAAVNAYANFLSIESGNQSLQQARSKFAAESAMLRYKNDPKQKEKVFVRECWDAWQKKPKSYTGKADFARSMLDKCEHLKSQKKIEDWCRDWEALNAFLPAE